MTQKQFIKGASIAAGITLILAAGLYINKNQSRDLFRADLIVGGGSVDPLRSPAVCEARSSGPLVVSDGAGLYNWEAFSVESNGVRTPATYPALRGLDAVGAEVTGPSLANAQGSVTFNAPDSTFNLNIDHFEVDASSVGAVPGSQTFRVRLAPPCVSQIEFLDPNPNGPVIPDPTTNTVEIKKIRATFSNGKTKDYSADVMVDGRSELSGLDLQFTANPTANVRLNGNKIILSQAHASVTVDMLVQGNNVAPGYADNKKLDNLTFADPRVNPDSLVIYEIHTNALNPADTRRIYQEFGVDYQFNRATTEGGTDSITLLGIRTLPPPLTTVSYVASYSYARPDIRVTAERPLTIGGNTCEEMQSNIFQGRGQGFLFSSATQTLPTGSKSTPFDFRDALNVNNVLVPITAGQFVLQSAEVRPETVSVSTVNNGVPGTPLALNTDYQFNEGTRGNSDFITLIANRPSSNATSLFISYSYANPNLRPINQIVITNNPQITTGQTFGSSSFQLTFNFVDNLSDRAVVTNRDNFRYEISVRRETNATNTANNFAYALNTLIPNGPVIAYVATTNTAAVELHSTEVGVHTNNYQCSVNGTAFSANTCFTGGLLPVGATPYLDPPRPLEPTLYRGENKTIYARGGTGAYTWRSSDPTLLKVVALNDQPTTRPPLTNENILFNQSMDQADFRSDPLTAGITNIIAIAGNCQYTQRPAATPGGPLPDRDLEACDVTVSVPITYMMQGQTFPITITTPDGPLSKQVTGSGNMTGTLTGTARATKQGDGNVVATGILTGNVGGDAIGGVTATVTMNIAVDPEAFTGGGIVPIATTGANPVAGVRLQNISGNLTKATTLIPTVIDPRAIGESVVTNFATLQALKSGTATIYVTDRTGCTAPLDIEVKGEHLMIEPEGYNPGDILEPNDSRQLRAFLGFTIEQRNEVTNTVTWTSDNPTVASVSATGRLTALTTGNANITATYQTTNPAGERVVSQSRIPVRITLLEGLTVTLDPAAISRLAPETRAAAYQNVVVAIHSENAVGKQIILSWVQPPVSPATTPVNKTHTFTLREVTPPLPFRTKAEHIRAIRNALLDDIRAEAIPGGVLTVTSHNRMAGVFTISSQNGTPISITTTANTQDFTLLPVINREVTLDRNQTYQAQVIGEYDNGMTKLLTNYVGTKWVNTPLNYLRDALLETGLIRIGELKGTSNLYVSFNNGLRDIRSNTLTFTIPTGPYIESVQVIGNRAITRGSTLDLLIRAGDIDSVADLQSIDVLLAKVTNTALTTYDAILADPGTQIFTLSSALDQMTEQTPVQTQSPASPPPASTGASTGTTTGTTTGSSTGTSTGPSTGTTPSSTPVQTQNLASPPASTNPSPFTRNFRLSIQIPQVSDLVDGTYKLLIQVTDKRGQKAAFVRDFRVGAMASGDVNNDGRIDINDAIAAFRFYTGAATPNAENLRTLDTNNNGVIDLLEVVTLLRTIMSIT